MTKPILTLAALIALTTASTDAFAKNHGHRRASRGVAQVAAEGGSSAVVPTIIVKFSSVKRVDQLGGGIRMSRAEAVIESVQTVGMADDAVNEADYAGKNAVIEGFAFSSACTNLATAALTGDRKYTLELVDAGTPHLRLDAPSVSQPNGVAVLNLRELKAGILLLNCSISRE